MSADVVTLTTAQVAAGGLASSDVCKIFGSWGTHDLIVFPEVVNVPYFPVGTELDSWLSSWSTDEAEVLDPYRALAQRMQTYVVVGLCIGEEGRRRNVAVVLDRDGHTVEGTRIGDSAPVGLYDKVHLCNVSGYGAEFHEDEYFRPGLGLMTWDLDFAKLGVLICYDRHFARAWETLADQGVDIIAIPTASPVDARPTFVAQMQAMALMNSVWAIVANRVGPEILPEGIAMDYLGESVVVSPDGLVRASAGAGAGLASTHFDSEAVTTARRSMGFATSRRPAIYLQQSSYQKDI